MQRDGSPKAVADEVSGLDVKMIQQSEEIRGKSRGRIPRYRHARQPVAAQIVHSHAEISRQDRYDAEVPESQVRELAVDHDEVRSMSRALVMQKRPVDFDLRHAS